MILRLLVGCGLRRRELAPRKVKTHLREGRWVLTVQVGKGRRVRTVAVPLWVKEGMNIWMTAVAIEDGQLLRSIRKGGKVGEGLSDWTVWDVVQQSAKQISIEHFGAHDLRRTAPSSAAEPAAISSRSSSCSGTRPTRPQNGVWGRNRRSPWP